VTTPGALALTGLLFGVLAIVFVLRSLTDTLDWFEARPYRAGAWAALSLSLLLFASAAWVEAL
jgi:hypothetical protein